jgi:hypothetical protein
MPIFDWMEVSESRVERIADDSATSTMVALCRAARLALFHCRAPKVRNWQKALKGLS